MDSKYITLVNGKIITEDTILENSVLRIKSGYIDKIADCNEDVLDALINFLMINIHFPFVSIFISLKNSLSLVGEYLSFRLIVSYDFFKDRFVIDIMGHESHKIEIGMDPLGNVT